MRTIRAQLKKIEQHIGSAGKSGICILFKPYKDASPDEVEEFEHKVEEAEKLNEKVIVVSWVSAA